MSIKNSFLDKFSFKYGFTLVELVIVITIIAILTGAGIQSYSSYSEITRDTKRLQDLNTISSLLEGYAKVNAVYPMPDNATTIVYGAGNVAWYQGTVSDGVSLALRLSPRLKDPIFKNTEYGYSITANKKEYELSSTYESANSFTYNDNDLRKSLAIKSEKPIYFIPTAYGDPVYSAIAMVMGTYNSLFVFSTGASGTTYIASPSITLASLSVTDLTNSVSLSGSFVVHRGKNIGSSYSANPLIMNGNFFFSPTSLGTYSGTLSNANIVSIMENLKTAYTGNILVSDGFGNSIWKNALNVASGSEAQISMGNSIISGLNNGSFSMGTNYSCSGSTSVVSGHSYSVPTIANGGTTLALSSSGITNGTRTFSQLFYCNAGVITSSGSETNMANTCNGSYVWSGTTNTCN